MATLLLPPRVLDPISEISTSIMVEGQLINTQVVIISNGDFKNPIAKGLARSSPQEFPLSSGVVLKAGSVIAAIQSYHGTQSEPSPDPVTVQAALKPLATPVICSHLYILPFIVGIDKLTAGAKAEIYKQTILLGSAANCTGSVGVGVLNKIAQGDTISVDQAGPSHATSSSVVSLPAEVPVMDPLPSPKINSPIECDTAILLSDVLDGSLVTIRRMPSTGKAEDLVYSYWGGTWYAPLSKPLKPNEKLLAKQEFQRRGEVGGDEYPPGSHSSWSDVVPVGSAQSLPQPIIWGPICPGATSALISNCRPGAILTLSVNVNDTKVVLGTWRVPQSSWCTVPLSKFPDGKGRKLFVMQTTCNSSSESNGTPIDDFPKTPDAPRLPLTLYACSGTVRVTNILPGTKVTIHSTKLQAPIAQLRVYSDHADIKVCPGLIKDDDIWAEQGGCSKDQAKSSTVHVSALDKLPKPVVQPFRLFTNPIKVSNVIPGALVNLWMGKQWLASAEAGDTTVDVYIPPNSLWSESKLIARQSLCSRISDQSDEVFVSNGKMKVNVQVGSGSSTWPVVFGEQCQLTVTTTDVDDNQSVQGYVYVDGVNVCQTGQTFSITFQATAAMPIGIVKAKGYDDAPISWPQPLRKMVLTVAPTSVKLGVPVSLIVSAYDMWTKATVNGTVQIKQYTSLTETTSTCVMHDVGLTFVTFNYTWPTKISEKAYPDSAAFVQVRSDGYLGADISQPQFDAPSPLTGVLTLNVNPGINNFPGVVTSNMTVKWHVSGPNISMESGDNPTNLSLPAPQNGGILECDISGTAKFDFKGILHTKNGTDITDQKDCIATFVKQSKIYWSGNSQSVGFVIKFNQDTGAFELS
jgi:hypothetical protein